MDLLLREKVRDLAVSAGGAVPAICVAFSGGLDSSVLLHLLAGSMRDARVPLIALHVNHGLSPNADVWEAHCSTVCAKLEVAFTAMRVQVRRGPAESLEEEARKARYAAFTSMAERTMALAHHAEDQAETVLLQMLRGAGPRGLAAMPEYALLPTGQGLWRPLLEVPRALIRQYAQAHGIAWIEDESNLDTGYKRNFLRNRVWPLLAEGFPAPAGTIARVARMQADAATLLGQLADLDINAAESADGLDCTFLKSLPRIRQANLLRRWLERAGARAPSEARLSALLKAIEDSTNDTRLTWVHENRRVLRRRNHLVIEPV